MTLTKASLIHPFQDKLGEVNQPIGRNIAANTNKLIYQTMKDANQVQRGNKLKIGSSTSTLTKLQKPLLESSLSKLIANVKEEPKKRPSDEKWKYKSMIIE